MPDTCVPPVVCRMIASESIRKTPDLENTRSGKNPGSEKDSGLEDDLEKIFELIFAAEAGR
jgi:hypothetical protein